jgi:hypothetical protein
LIVTGLGDAEGSGLPDVPLLKHHFSTSAGPMHLSDFNYATSISSGFGSLWEIESQSTEGIFTRKL